MFCSVRGVLRCLRSSSGWVNSCPTAVALGCTAAAARQERHLAQARARLPGQLEPVVRNMRRRPDQRLRSLVWRRVARHGSVEGESRSTLPHLGPCPDMGS